ncbi:MAG: LytR/AlgR family response regulator transcription factor [Flavobacteriales bacterium]
MNVIIIEDEKYVALNLADAIERSCADYKVHTILSSVAEAVSYFKNNSSYDLVFSDVNLGDGTCFDIFDEVEITAPVIFCAAYEQYSLDAFEANGIDFILKPFNAERIERAIVKFEKLSFHILQQQKNIEVLSSIFRRQKKIVVHYNGKMIPLAWEEIALFYIQNEVTYVADCTGRSYALSQTLEQIEQEAGKDFYRVNRQFLLQRKSGKEILKNLNRTLTLLPVLDFREKITVSKEKASAFLKWMSGE